MDNASFHRKIFLETIAEAYGHRILWLPAYSPDKNPIEHLDKIAVFEESASTVQMFVARVKPENGFYLLNVALLP
jgi:hypothetical protein